MRKNILRQNQSLLVIIPFTGVIYMLYAVNGSFYCCLLLLNYLTEAVELPCYLFRNVSITAKKYQKENKYNELTLEIVFRY